MPTHTTDDDESTDTQPLADDLATTDRVRARVGHREFSGRYIGKGWDSEPVIYFKDRRGFKRAVRPQRDRHTIEGGVNQ